MRKAITIRWGREGECTCEALEEQNLDLAWGEAQMQHHLYYISNMDNSLFESCYRWKFRKIRKWRYLR